MARRWFWASRAQRTYVFENRPEPGGSSWLSVRPSNRKVPSGAREIGRTIPNGNRLQVEVGDGGDHRPLAEQPHVDGLRSSRHGEAAGRPTEPPRAGVRDVERERSERQERERVLPLLVGDGGVRSAERNGRAGD